MCFQKAIKCELIEQKYMWTREQFFKKMETRQKMVAQKVPDPYFSVKYLSTIECKMNEGMSKQEYFASAVGVDMTWMVRLQKKFDVGRVYG